jgi:hypothetical protein
MSKSYSDTFAEFKIFFVIENELSDFMQFDWIYLNQNESGNSITIVLERPLVLVTV